MNKSLITTGVAASLVAIGLVLNAPFREPILSMGMYALAGGITNWLAVYMLFEKVPGLYGSGVISARFEEFKSGIYGLVMDQFFSKQNLDRFFEEMITESENPENHMDFHQIIDQTDFNPAFDGLVAVIMGSSFGSMLSMVGGKGRLTSLKEPYIAKMKESLNEMAHSDSFQSSIRNKLKSKPVNAGIHQQIEHLVKSRLEELTPQMVKDIIQTMIREHLGWLVVWGGVFGGLIVLLASQLPI